MDSEDENKYDDSDDIEYLDEEEEDEHMIETQDGDEEELDEEVDESASQIADLIEDSKTHRQLRERRVQEPPPLEAVRVRYNSDDEDEEYNVEFCYLCHVVADDDNEHQKMVRQLADLVTEKGVPNVIHDIKMYYDMEIKHGLPEPHDWTKKAIKTHFFEHEKNALFHMSSYVTTTWQTLKLLKGVVHAAPPLPDGPLPLPSSQYINLMNTCQDRNVILLGKINQYKNTKNTVNDRT